MKCPSNLTRHGAQAKEDKWESDRCSYCGSMHPDVFMQSVIDGTELTPTDKNYKVYIGETKFYFEHLSDEQRATFTNLLNAGVVKLAYPGRFYVAPYWLKRVDFVPDEL